MRGLTQRPTAPEPWTVFADIVLAALFLFVLFIFAQYVYYEKVAIQEELEARQERVRNLVNSGVPATDSVVVQEARAFSQRVTFSSDLLFPSCRDQLRQEGRRVVGIVGEILRSRTNYFESIEVEGHTDRQQPTASEVCPFLDNWELSSRRAATVVRLLASDASLPPRHLSAVGRGEYVPADSVEEGSDALDEEQNRRDRRIELVLQYSETDIQDSLRLRSEESPEL